MEDHKRFHLNPEGLGVNLQNKIARWPWHVPIKACESSLIQQAAVENWYRDYGSQCCTRSIDIQINGGIIGLQLVDTLEFRSISQMSTRSSKLSVAVWWVLL